MLGTLGAVWKRVAELATLDPSFEPYLSAREGIKAQLEDLAMTLRRYADGLDVSPHRLQQIEERLALLERLKRKDGPTLNDVSQRRETLAREVAELETSEVRLGKLEAELSNLRERFLADAQALSGRRRQAASLFVPGLIDLLGDLALEDTRFEVRFNPEPLSESEWSALGIDRAEFHVSTNPGEELRPLARIVSGGELSRIMLALKTLTQRARRVAGGARRPGAPPALRRRE